MLTDKDKKVMKIIVAIGVMILVLASVGVALAIDPEDVKNISDSIVPSLNNSINIKHDQLMTSTTNISGQVATVSTQVGTVQGQVNTIQNSISAIQNQLSTAPTFNANLSDAQINNVVAVVKNTINTSVSTVCSPYFNPDKTLADPLQVALSGAIDNAMAKQFIDEQNWMQQTLLPKQADIVKAQDDLKSCNTERQIIQNNYDTAKIAANVTQELCQQQLKNADDSVTNMSYWLIATILLMFASHFHSIRDYIRKEKR